MISKRHSLVTRIITLITAMVTPVFLFACESHSQSTLDYNDFNYYTPSPTYPTYPEHPPTLETIPTIVWDLPDYIVKPNDTSPNDGNAPNFQNKYEPDRSPPISKNYSLTFLRYPNTVQRNETAYVSIQGKPYTRYSITVMYSSGPSSASGLESKNSGSDGFVSWSWHIGGRTAPGTFTITVSGGGETKTVYFRVTT